MILPIYLYGSEILRNENAEADLQDREGLTKLISDMKETLQAADGCGLAKDSIVLLEQVRTLDKKRLREKMGILDESDMLRVDRALSVSLGITAE